MLTREPSRGNSVKKLDIHCRLTPSQYAEIKRIAKEMDRSVNYLVRKIVRDWLIHEAPKHDPNLTSPFSSTISAD